MTYIVLDILFDIVLVGWILFNLKLQSIRNEQISSNLFSLTRRVRDLESQRAVLTDVPWHDEDIAEILSRGNKCEGASETICVVGQFYKQDCQPRPGLEFDPNAGGNL